MYQQFCNDVLPGHPGAPLSVPECTLFVAFLHAAGYSPATMATYLSAVCFIFRWLGYPDPSTNFVVKKLLGASQNLHSQPDIRLPITKQILTRLLEAVPLVFTSIYKQKLLAALFITAFYAFLRIGEMVPKSLKTASSCLHYNDLTFSTQEVILSVLRFKTSKSQGPQFIQLESREFPCPVAFLRDFLSFRGVTSGPFFILQSGNPILRKEFDYSLKLILNFCGLNTDRFKGHSFRIGAASEAASNGKSDAEIRLLGRWASDAFRKYIRIN